MIIYFCFEGEDKSDKFWIWVGTGSDGKEYVRFGNKISLRSS
jgi:hypothetical protein